MKDMNQCLPIQTKRQNMESDHINRFQRGTVLYFFCIKESNIYNSAVVTATMNTNEKLD